MNTLPAGEKRIVKRLSMFTLCSVVVLVFGLGTQGQTPTPSPTTPTITGVIGEVKAIDSTANQMIVRADRDRKSVV